MVTVSILFNPGMSKMRESEERRGPRKSSQAGPWEKSRRSGFVWALGARCYFYSRGAERVARRTGESAGSSEPLQSPRSQHLVLLSPLQ